MKQFLFFSFLVFYGFCYGQIPAVYIPLEKSSQLKIDGGINDWDWVPENYMLTDKSLECIKSERATSCDYWNCKLFFAWSDVKNWLYIVIITRDNVHKIKSLQNKVKDNIEDNIEIAVNPSNQGGDYYSKRFARYYNIIKSTIAVSAKDNKQAFVVNNGPEWLLKDKNLLQWKSGVKKEYKKNDSIEIVYELGFALWDEWSEISKDHSKRHELKSNDLIGLTVALNKAEEKKNARAAQWVTSTGTFRYWMNNADDISKIILTPPSDTANLWNGISKVLNP